jgi:hypothetical protein
MTELKKEIAHLQELQAKHRQNIRTLTAPEAGISIVVSGSGALATQGGVVAGEGGVAVKGDIEGDIQIG